MKSCSWCAYSGHTRATCPRRKKHIEELRSEDPTSWSVLEYDREQENRKIRRCSYCRKTGHNRKSCKLLIEDLKDARGSCREWREEALREMKSSGLGIGSLVRYHDKVGLVMGFRWAQASQMSSQNPDQYWNWRKEGSKSGNPPKKWLLEAPIPRLLEVRMTNGREVRWPFPFHPLLAPYSKVHLVSPINPTFANSVPTDWVEDEPPYDIMRFFKKGTNR